VVTFYLEQNNTILRHAAFAGQTPDEMYRGRGEELAGNLGAVRAHAREARIEANRGLTCAACRVPAEASSDTRDSLALSNLLQLHAGQPRMSWFAAAQLVYADLRQRSLSG
jgi:hypothetical protein